ncbi:hypothetical protein FKM82_022609 [Ascaphus truei]
MGIGNRYTASQRPRVPFSVGTGAPSQISAAQLAVAASPAYLASAGIRPLSPLHRSHDLAGRCGTEDCPGSAAGQDGAWVSGSLWVLRLS